MQIDTHLAALAQTDLTARRAALEAALEAEGLTPEIQECASDEKHQAARNYLLRDPSGQTAPLLCAHYDAHPGSTGANDNAAACCILLTLAPELRRRGIACDFAFFDGEECGHTGAKLYEERRTWDHTAVINLDMCGYGDTITVCSHGSIKKAAIRGFCDAKRLAEHSAQIVKYLPEGDDCRFTTRDQPVLSVAIMPKWDTKYLEAMALQGSGILGRTPEFKMMIGQMEVASTMHGGFRDDIKWVQPAAMQQVYDYLLAALCAPAAKGPSLFGR